MPSRARPALLNFDELVHALQACKAESEVALLAFRMSELGELAWHHGRHAAKIFARDVVDVFIDVACGSLRQQDLLAYDPDGRDFVIVLTAAREPATQTPLDARKVLARVSALFGERTATHITTGTATVHRIKNRADFEQLLNDAFLRGAREQERFTFLSMIGHELRTPLTAIRGYLETLRDGDLAFSQRAQFLDIAYLETLRLGRIVDGIFDISMLDIPASAAMRERCSLERVIAAAQIAVAAASDRHNVRIEWIIAIAAQVDIAHDHLVSVFVNLVENAAKHGRSGGRIRVTATPAGDAAVTICIEDDGPGIAANDRERVFTIGERLGSRAPGTGIGLSFVRLVIERAGGKIALDTSPLGGLQCTIALPCVIEAT